MKSVSSSLHSGRTGRWRGVGLPLRIQEGSGKGWEHERFLKQNKAKQRGLFQNFETGKKSFSFIPSAR